MSRDDQRPYVLFLPENERAYFEPSEEISVLELAMRAEIPLNHSCGGMGSCTTCRVMVESDLKTLPERNEVEAECAVERNFPPNERLSCQLLAQPGLQLRRPIPKR